MAEDPIQPKFMDVPARLISARTIIMTIETILTAGLKDDFVNKCEEKNRGMIISKDDMDFIKQYIADFANKTLLDKDEKNLLPNLKHIATSNPQC